MRGTITVIAVILSLCAPSLCPALPAADELHLVLTLTRGERSKDSNSTTESITLKGRKLVYDRSYHGHGAHRREPVHKEFQLARGELESLRNIIRRRNLLVSESKEFPAAEGYHYFDVSLRIELEGNRSDIRLHGKPRNTQIKGDALCQNTEALIKEIFGSLQRQDKSIVYRGVFD